MKKIADSIVFFIGNSESCPTKIRLIRESMIWNLHDDDSRWNVKNLQQLTTDLDLGDTFNSTVNSGP